MSITQKFSIEIGGSTPIGPSPEDLRRIFEPAIEEKHEDADGSILGADTARKAAEQRTGTEFYPRKPASIAEAGLTPEFVEQLICKFLLTRGSATGRRIAQQLGLPFRALEGLLTRAKNEMLLAYRKTAAAGDYEYVLTDTGNDRARRSMDACTYAESAPVPLDDYIASVGAQSLTHHRINAEHLREAFFDLLVGDDMLDRLGPAVNSGKGMFLYGSPGNGKTSIAERVIRCFGSHLWIPRAIQIDGNLFRMFDPVIHQVVAEPEANILGEGLEDGRWVKIVRPTVVVGGELTMDQLEMRHDVQSNVSEAPLQMKSNCGALVIDDFGRQRMPIAELLNRWIVPLEKRYDYQKLPSGKKIQVPFDQLVIFSTNLEPHDLVDEAFLRRIPYKIEAPNPTPAQFKRIVDIVAPALGFRIEPGVIDHLIEKHYVAKGRPMRACHPRDLMLQARSYCMYHKLPVELSEQALDFAVENYFAVM
ncbi:MAG TPA: AAA family ATPase [Candidatus Binatia bacterium]|nr:AAA family ATPase [Candidatus Binatia bacterium]